MPSWPRYPTIYEINTWVWLYDLGKKSRRAVTLSSVPASVWDAIAGYGFDAVWLMGVWERSPAGVAIASQNRGLLDDFRRALPDLRPQDNVGSPYCVRRYAVDSHLGGPEGLAAARRELAQRGIRLVLDFVPNHVAPDHPWVVDHPEYFIQGKADDVRREPASFVAVGGNVFANGRDPFFPAWSDVLQLNAFHPGLRQAMTETVAAIGNQCDGIRCDMAMLLLNPVFERTWGQRAGKPPATEYWRDLIPAIRKAYPDFLFIAEAYWNLEWDLQQQGFDFCYDKRLYDRLERDGAESVRLHLCGDLDYQAKLLRFIENHDEPRAAAAFSTARGQVAAVTLATLPGARLFHEGQFEGRRVRLPVFLGRRRAEPVDEAMREFYQRLLSAVNAPVFRDGQWRLCECTGWPDNVSYRSIVGWSWVLSDDHYVITVNLADSSAQAQVQLRWNELGERTWRLMDLLSGETYDRDGNQMRDEGLYVDLPAWSSHLFHLRPA